jgi:hypothetical protein
LALLPVLTWSSRENLRAQLLSVLSSLPREEDALRRRTLLLLGLFGGLEQLPLMRALILDPTESPSVRDAALSAGLRHGLELSSPELASLLEASMAQTSGACRVPSFPWMGNLLPLVRTEEACAVAEGLLLRVQPSARAKMLAHGALRDSGLFPPLEDWLHAQWAREDQRQLEEDGEGDLNLRVALGTRERPASQEFLLRRVREMTPAELAESPLWSLPCEELLRWVEPHPAAFRLAAEALKLPLPVLLSHFGRDALLRRVEQVVRAQAVSCRVDHGHLLARREFLSAVRLLGEWPEARPLLLRSLCDLHLEEEVRRPMLRELFARERAVAIRWALAAMDWPENTALVRRFLHRAVLAPEPGDRALFLKALHGSDAVAQCFAIEGLLGLGESGAAWCGRLTSLLQASHPAVRLRAAAGLIQEGRREELPALRQTALQASEPWLRAEAVRWLGEVDAEASQPVFAAALSDRGSWDLHQIPLGSDEAIWALSRHGAPEDLSLLLNAYLRSCFSYVLDEYLVFHLARQEGRPAEEVPPPPCRLYSLDILERGS